MFLYFFVCNASHCAQAALATFNIYLQMFKYMVYLLYILHQSEILTSDQFIVPEVEKAPSPVSVSVSAFNQ